MDEMRTGVGVFFPNTGRPSGVCCRRSGSVDRLTLRWKPGQPSIVLAMHIPLCPPHHQRTQRVYGVLFVLVDARLLLVYLHISEDINTNSCPLSRR